MGIAAAIGPWPIPRVGRKPREGGREASLNGPSRSEHKVFMYAFDIICIRRIGLTLKPLAVRIPEEVEREIQEAVEREGLDKAIMVRALLELGMSEWRRRRALELLRDGKVTFAKAAEMAKLPLWEFADLVKQHGIEWVRYTPEEIEEELKGAQAAGSR
jgi:predicted HTH domain antitoxin